MTDLQAALRTCIDSRDALRSYLEANGSDGSPELAALRSEESAAFANFEVQLGLFAAAQ